MTEYQSTLIAPGGVTPPTVMAGQPVTECPKCRSPLGSLPFCPRDGTLTSSTPFSIGQRYVVSESLGVGGAALVFGGRHELLGRAVAVKILRPELAADATQAQRFLREARLASGLHHENIVNVLDFGHDAQLDLYYFVMERLFGPTLADLMRQAGPLPWVRVVPILLQLARAMAAAHEQKVVHRDLKPRNVVLTSSSNRSDVVKLCDFGVSRLTSGEDRLTAAGALVGTPAYMAPEQIRGEEVQSTAADIYGFGVTAYEALTSRLPHEAATQVALISSKLHEDAAPLRKSAPQVALPAPLEDLIMRCLARDPSQRPASAVELQRSLLAIAPTPGLSEVSLPNDLVGQVVGSYRVTRLLGVGGVGAVYAAEHPLIGTKVAVKVLLPEVTSVPGMVDRFVQEARASSEIGSPHIPRYFDFGYLPGGTPFAIMEYLEGETVAQHLARLGPLPLYEVTEILCQVAEAMTQAHAAGIVHRDLKPDNLWLSTSPEGRPAVKVLDFGVARVLTAPASGRLTTVGFILGTPFYCAPEQSFGGEVGPAADIYALGATAFELLTSHAPFEGEVSEVLTAKTTSEAPSVRTLRPDLPRVVEETLARLVARSPADRPQSMTEVRVLLDAWRMTEPTPAVTAEPLVPARRPRLWALALGVGLGLAITALVLLGALRLHEPKPLVTSGWSDAAEPVIAPAAAVPQAAAAPTPAAPDAAAAPGSAAPHAAAAPASAAPHAAAAPGSAAPHAAAAPAPVAPTPMRPAAWPAASPATKPVVAPAPRAPVRPTARPARPAPARAAAAAPPPPAARPPKGTKPHAPPRGRPAAKAQDAIIANPFD
jgi:serine/threonine-protein kinase